MTGNFKGENSCPRCSASVKPGSRYCWQCGGEVTPVCRQTSSEPIQAEYPMAEEVQTHASATFGISSLLLIITLISICLGLFVAAPGLGIVVAIVSLAPLIRTVMVVNRRRGLGKTVDSNEKASLFLGSLGVTLIIIGVTMAACCAAFVGSCFGALAIFGLGGPPDQGMQSLLMFLIWCMPLAAGCVSLWLFSYWIRNRWRRDTRP